MKFGKSWHIHTYTLYCAAMESIFIFIISFYGTKMEYRPIIKNITTLKNYQKKNLNK